MSVLKRILVYPIKSTAPLELDEARISPRGIRHDRRFIATDRHGKFLTARRFPRMLLIKATLLDDGIEVNAPGMPVLRLHPAEFGQEYMPVAIWKDQVSAQRCPPYADQWFSDYLGKEARLVFMGPQSERPARGGGEVSFADASPLMVLSEASLQRLNEKLHAPMDMRRFRPNLVVDGVGAHDEDEFGDFSIGSARLRAMWPCIRCVLTTIDPDTTELHPGREPLTTLLTYRNSDDEVMFGVNVSVTQPGTIRVGDRVQRDQVR